MISSYIACNKIDEIISLGCEVIGATFSSKGDTRLMYRGFTFGAWSECSSTNPEDGDTQWWTERAIWLNILDGREKIFNGVTFTEGPWMADIEGILDFVIAELKEAKKMRDEQKAAEKRAAEKIQQLEEEFRKLRSWPG